MNPSLDTLRDVPARMIEGWNRGDAAAFAADFAHDAELIDFDGTLHKGRDTVIAFQQPAFDTVLKGSRLVQGQVEFARLIGPGCAVVHHRFGMVMAGEEEPRRPGTSCSCSRWSGRTTAGRSRRWRTHAGSRWSPPWPWTLRRPRNGDRPVPASLPGHRAVVPGTHGSHQLCLLKRSMDCTRSVIDFARRWSLPKASDASRPGAGGDQPTPAAGRRPGPRRLSRSRQRGCPAR